MAWQSLFYNEIASPAKMRDLSRNLRDRNDKKISVGTRKPLYPASCGILHFYLQKMKHKSVSAQELKHYELFFTLSLPSSPLSIPPSAGQEGDRRVSELFIKHGHKPCLRKLKLAATIN
jgi:hypothetical protein